MRSGDVGAVPETAHRLREQGAAPIAGKQTGASALTGSSLPAGVLKGLSSVADARSQWFAWEVARLRATHIQEATHRE